MEGLMIRPAGLGDAEQIVRIYNYYIENTVITFEEEKISTDEMRGRIEEYTRDYPWFVYEKDHEVIGYAYAAKWRSRSAYRYSAETTVYVDKDFCGKGTGTALYEKLIEECAKRGLHALMAGITMPNKKSQRLHEKIGFKKIGHFQETGRKFDKWLDVGYWEYIFK